MRFISRFAAKIMPLRCAVSSQPLPLRAPVNSIVRFLGAVYLIPHPLSPAQAIQLLTLCWRHAQAHSYGFLASFHWWATLAPFWATALTVCHICRSIRTSGSDRPSLERCLVFQQGPTGRSKGRCTAFFQWSLGSSLKAMRYPASSSATSFV
jgi:hypothetical protein